MVAHTLEKCRYQFLELVGRHLGNVFSDRRSSILTSLFERARRFFVFSRLAPILGDLWPTSPPCLVNFPGFIQESLRILVFGKGVLALWTQRPPRIRFNEPSRLRGGDGAKPDHFLVPSDAGSVRIILELKLRWRPEGLNPPEDLLSRKALGLG